MQKSNLTRKKALYYCKKKRDWLDYSANSKRLARLFYR